MSVRIAYFSPSLTRPIAIPATEDFNGIPACINARLAPQTLAIEEDPFDSRMSETMRTVYGDSASLGRTAEIARSAKRSVANFATTDAGHTSNFSNGKRRKVIVKHEAFPLLAFKAFQALRIVDCAQGRGDQRLSFAAGEQRRSVDARQHADFDRDIDESHRTGGGPDECGL